MRRFEFNKIYFVLFLILLFTEVFIALFVHDQIIRPYIGDVLVVMLVYCFLKSFIQVSVLPTAISVLLFCFFIETMQYFQIVNLLGLGDNRLATTVIGNSFAWMDIWAYVAGFVFIVCAELFFVKKVNKNSFSSNSWR